MSVADTLQPYLGDEPYAFVCYDYADSSALARDVAPLVAAGARCFFDETSQTGSRWSDDFAARLLGARLFLFFVSGANVTTERTRRELGFVIDANIPVIAIRLDDAEVPPGMRLLLATETVLSYTRLTPNEVSRELINHLQQSPFSAIFAEQTDAETVYAKLEELGPGDMLVNRFRLLDKIGKGGMSFVYTATDTETYGEPTVAIKIINPKFAAHPDSLVTLKRETAKTQILNHPNIVNVRDFRNDGPIAFMWMEYLDGESLSERLKREQKLPPQEVTIILQGIKDGLDHAHKNGIVHADFKPGNVMLTASPVTDPGQVRLIDFGIALAYRAEPDQTNTDTIFDPAKLGAYTPEYASPELIARHLGAHPSDDVYAVACMTYEMMTGSHPFGRTSAELASQAELQVKGDAALSAAQLAALKRGLAFTRAERTQSVAEFFTEFAGSSTAEPTGDTVVNADLDATVFSPGPADDETVFALDEEVSAPAQKSGQRRWLVVAGLAVMLMVAAVVFLLRPSQVPSSDPVPRIFVDCAGCPAMLAVTPGEYLQGNDVAQLSSETPQRLIQFRHAFAVSAAEVSVAEYRAFAQATGQQTDGCEIYRDGQWISDADADWRGPGFAQTDEHPAVCVSWTDAQAFAGWLAEQSGQSYRLLSASEWEYLARRERSGGDLCSIANVADQTAGQQHAQWTTADCEDGSVYTRAALAGSAADAGIQNLLGNAFEWVEDCWNPTYAEAPVDGRAWLAGDCAHRELRGGSWYTQPEFVSPTFRNHLPNDTRTSTIGFRVARDMPEQG